MYKTYGIIIPNSFPTWKPTVTQKHTLAASNGKLKKFWRLWIQRNGHAIQMSIWSTLKHHIPLITLRDKRTIIGAIEQFDVHGRYPDGRRRHELFERGAYPLLSPEFKSIIDFTVKWKKNVARKPTTIYTESHNASTFFLSLQQKGMNSLDKITEEAVLSIFMSSDETLLRSCSYKKNIAAVLKACIPYHPETCPRLLAFLPALRETRKNIQYLTSEEIQKVKDALADGENLLTLRDKAMGMLALYTGLRGCDIAGLTLDVH